MFFLQKSKTFSWNTQNYFLWIRFIYSSLIFLNSEESHILKDKLYSVVHQEAYPSEI